LSFVLLYQQEFAFQPLQFGFMDARSGFIHYGLHFLQHLQPFLSNFKQVALELSKEEVAKLGIA
jgi:hypothetical protein